MKKNGILACSAIVTVALMLGGCIGSAPYDGFKTPLLATFKAPVPGYYSAMTPPAGKALKHGQSTHTAYIGLVSEGSLSVIDAAKSAGITHITDVEYEYKNRAFFLYQEITMHVYGY